MLSLIMSSPKSFYITTAIDYTNAAPHLGHAYEKVLADVIARWKRFYGVPCHFLTGVDQHGQKVQMAAAKEGLTPAEYARRETAKFRELWEVLGLSNDGWVETTHEAHKRVVQFCLSKLHAEGELYKAVYNGFYSVRQEQFLTDKERGPDGNFGPEWGEVVELEESNWYFPLAKHRDWLVNLLKSREVVFPAFRQQELLNAAERISGDLCISRPKERLSWGIELPFDTDFVTYVWFDALINYISWAGFESGGNKDLPDFSRLWPANAHLIGKDILIPAHGIYWLIMLHAIGFTDDEMPGLLVHGFWGMDGAKLSKSSGVVIDPRQLAEKFSPEALRYYLMRDIATGQDADFNLDRLIGRYNSDLANDIGNLVNRALSMTKRYRDGIVPPPRNTGIGAELETAAAALCPAFVEQMEKYQIHAALDLISGFASLCNGFVERTAPWKLAKDPEKASELDDVLRSLVESIRLIAILLAPILPTSSAAILRQAGLDPELETVFSRAKWGLLPKNLKVEAPTPVFPRIESESKE